MIAIISDIHGNYPALAAAISEMDKLNCKKIISLGDVAGYYCMINECIDLLSSRNIPNIMGNHDDFLINNHLCNRSTSVNVCIEYQRRILSPSSHEYLQRSIPYYDNSFMSARHGGWHDLLDEYVKDFYFDEFISRADMKRIYTSGHTHIQVLSLSSDSKITYVNPGSIGQPRDGISTAAFAIVDDDYNVTLHRVKYDIDEIAGKMKQSGFEEKYYKGLYYGLKIGQIK